MKITIDMNDIVKMGFKYKQLNPQGVNANFLDGVPCPIRYKIWKDNNSGIFNECNIKHRPPTLEEQEHERKLIEKYKGKYLVYPSFDKKRINQIMGQLVGIDIADTKEFIKDFDELLSNLFGVYYVIVEIEKEAIKIRDSLNIKLKEVK